MTHRLPADYSRCHDADCSQRGGCLRWLDRHNGYSHLATYQPEFDRGPFVGPCPGLIPVPEAP